MLLCGKLYPSDIMCLLFFMQVTNPITKYPCQLFQLRIHICFPCLTINVILAIILFTQAMPASASNCQSTFDEQI